MTLATIDQALDLLRDVRDLMEQGEGAPWDAKLELLRRLRAAVPDPPHQTQAVAVPDATGDSSQAARSARGVSGE